MRNIGILIAAYNRPHSLKRILHSIENAWYKYKNIPLIISIDWSEDNEVLKIAQNFSWEHGEKQIIHHKEHLGLKKHIISCGDMVEHFEGIIVLEDDLFVSPEFYNYAQEAFNFYEEDDRIAGIALFSPIYNEFSFTVFNPIIDGYDNYFMQVPCSWGQMYSNSQWKKYKDFLNKGTIQYNRLKGIYNKWKTHSSWKKDFFVYMLEENKYFVYPRFGLTTNFGDSGAHYCGIFKRHQTRILVDKKKYEFSTIDTSNAIYDYSYEYSPKQLKRANKKMKNYNFECDFFGSKLLEEINSEYLLSPKKCRKPIFKFACELIPPEMNILLDIPGNFYYFGLKVDFKPEEDRELKEKKEIVRSNNTKENISALKKHILSDEFPLLYKLSKTTNKKIVVNYLLKSKFSFLFKPFINNL